MRTASLKAKLIQMLMAMREEVLYGAFIYLHKAYNDLEWIQYFHIFVAYSVGTRLLRLLR